jgi:acyl-CoA thioesterase I
MNCSNVRVFLLVVMSVLFAPMSFASAQIVALGSSTVQGAVPENEMWPAVLEGMLHAKGSSVHVTNAGVWGETTGATLARVSSAVPQGTKTVILMVNGYNDARKLSEGSAHSAANIAAIKSQLKARGIKVIDAMGVYVSVLKQPGMAVVDGIHLSVEGNKKVAAILAGMLRESATPESNATSSARSIPTQRSPAKSGAQDVLIQFSNSRGCVLAFPRRD